MNNYEFKITRIHSHEYTVKVNDEYYRLTKMEYVQNWDIEKFNPDSAREFDYVITFSTLRECKDYLSEIHKVDIK
jgi:hypothetical protein